MLTEGPTREEAVAVDEHFAYLQRLVGENVVLLAGRTLNQDEHAFGIVIFVAATAAQALAIMHGDPAVKQGGDDSGVVSLPDCVVVTAGATAGGRRRVNGWNRYDPDDAVARILTGLENSTFRVL